MKAATPFSKKISLDNYVVLTTLGTGSFGRVRLVKEKKTGKFFALKMLKKSEILRLKQADHVQSEITILFDISHPFLPVLHGITQDSAFLYLMLDYIAGGEIFTYMKTEGKLTNEATRLYIGQVTLMFEYLHSKDIVYRDLKPENLLLLANGYLTLVDFGFAKYCKTRTYTLCGTPEYLAPEILLNKGHGKPVDWWCMGILLYEMHAGAAPYTDEDPMQVYQKILKGNLKFPRSFDKDAKSLVKHLLVHDVSERYGCMKDGVDDIKKHRWFASFNFSSLLKMEYPAPFVPVLSNPGDTSNFCEYPDSETDPIQLKPGEDPFLEW